MRASGHSLCNVVARFGGFCAPYLVFSDLSYEVIGIFLCCANITASIAASLLPETSHKDLDHIRTESVTSESPIHKLSQSFEDVIRKLSGHDNPTENAKLLRPVTLDTPDFTSSSL